MTPIELVVAVAVAVRILWQQSKHEKTCRERLEQLSRRIDSLAERLQNSENPTERSLRIYRPGDTE